MSTYFLVYPPSDFIHPFLIRNRGWVLQVVINMSLFCFFLRISRYYNLYNSGAYKNSVNIPEIQRDYTNHLSQAQYHSLLKTLTSKTHTQTRHVIWFSEKGQNHTVILGYSGSRLQSSLS